MSIPKLFVGYSNLNENNCGTIKTFSKSIWEVSRHVRSSNCMKIFKVRILKNTVRFWIVSRLETKGMLYLSHS